MGYQPGVGNPACYVVKEIVNRGGWSSGNAIVIIVDGSGRRTAESFNGVSAAAPLLHVTFTN